MCVLTDNAMFSHCIPIRRDLHLQVSQHSGHLSRAQQTDLNERRIALQRRIRVWRQIQMVYMPCVATLLSDTDELDAAAVSSRHAENVPMFLPSRLPSTLHPQLRATGISPGLLDKEIKLRVAQADDALAELRRLRRLVTGLVLFKKLNISGTGQKKNTRIRTLFKRFGNKTERVAERYRAAYTALIAVGADGSWKSRFQILHPEDIRGPGREDYDRVNNQPEGSERRREQSWIWLVPRIESAPDIGVMEEHLDANLRVEWAKSRARAARWAEEVELLHEEMRRTITFFEWKAEWWRSRTGLRIEAEDLCHGLDAYAHKQAALLERRASSYATYWLPILKENGFTPPWEMKYTNSIHSKVADMIDDEAEDNSADEEDDTAITEDQVVDDFVIDP